MPGWVLSTTVTVRVQVEVFPAWSVAVIVMVLAPIPRVAPATGDWVMVAEPQSSVAEAEPARLGVLAWQLLLAGIVVPAGQVSVGAMVDCEVTRV